MPSFSTPPPRPSTSQYIAAAGAGDADAGAGAGAGAAGAAVLCCRRHACSAALGTGGGGSLEEGIGSVAAGTAGAWAGGFGEGAMVPADESGSGG